MDQRQILRTALFVDFDNIYIEMLKSDERAAMRFSQTPKRWVQWLERGMPSTAEFESAPQVRRILVQNCYLNPAQFWKARPYFTRSAFNVIDCPPLTSRGKNSLDIHMVMGVLDALHHNTHFDEVILMSGDSDFMPVLLRLRENDRQTLILSGGRLPEAYRNAASGVIETDHFIEHGLGIVGGEEVELEDPPEEYRATIEEASELIMAEVEESGRVGDRDVVNVLKEVDGFTRDSNWLGCYGLRNLARQIERLQEDLAIFGGEDHWYFGLASEVSDDDDDDEGDEGEGEHFEEDESESEVEEDFEEEEEESLESVE